LLKIFRQIQTGASTTELNITTEMSPAPMSCDQTRKAETFLYVSKPH
jgi:hypothetical protein